MKKEILFCSYNLDIGGIETSLLNMLNNLDLNKYNITLMLSKKEGIFLNNIPKEIKVIEYKISNNKNILFRKIYNRFKLIYNILKYKNKFDFAGCYATYLGPESIITRYASKNNALWIHSNYYYAYKKNINNLKKFFNKIKVEKFKKIIFVSNEAKFDLCKIYPSLNNKSYVLPNIIDYKKILKLGNEQIENYNKPVLIYVGRLEEESKKISRIINALKNISTNYTCLIIGDGIDKTLYKKMIDNYKLNDKILLLGKKNNPYPYIKNSDLVLLSSDYEGFPTILVESLILNKTFISTISSSNKYLDLKEYGYIVDPNDFEKELQKILKNRRLFNNSFDFELYIQNALKDLEKMIGRD